MFLITFQSYLRSSSFSVGFPASLSPRELDALLAPRATSTNDQLLLAVGYDRLLEDPLCVQTGQKCPVTPRIAEFYLHIIRRQPRLLRTHQAACPPWCTHRAHYLRSRRRHSPRVFARARTRYTEALCVSGHTLPGTRGISGSPLFDDILLPNYALL